MPQNSSMKTVKEMAAGQTFRFFFKNGNRQPVTASLLNTDRNTVATTGVAAANFAVAFKRAPNGRNAVKTITFAISTSDDGTPNITDAAPFTLTVNGVTTDAIAYSATGATLAANIKAALNALATDNLRAMTGGFNVVAGVSAANVTSGSNVMSQVVKIEFCGAYGKQPITLSVGITGLSLAAGATTGTISAAVTNTQVGIAPGSADANSLYEAVYPDGYTGTAYDSTHLNGTPITVQPGGQLVVAFGGAHATAQQANYGYLGPYVDIYCSSGRGQIELGFGPDDINEIVL